MSILEAVLAEEKRQALREEQAREERARFLQQLPLLAAQIEEEQRKAQDEERRRKDRQRFLQQELPLLLRIEQAAHELQLSRRRIYQLVQAGQLELVKIGKSSRITRASLLRLAGAKAE
jgi:excisionase family DNA binding protein